ncbi:hypothetical protein HGRIS_001785 [Hohenbuehelia grisea]|uniref:DUF453-domain-containing protein n=1 Tax=Hohenbuehelia grisea TaxID=104357 RepID=A0ABR3JIG6_9AGAR
MSTFTTPNPIPATFLRGGTSKGIFINRAHLPPDRAHWDPIFLGIMGSPDAEYGRQLNGMGGGVSSLSKICVVSSPTPEQASSGIHAEYTFVQVGIRDKSIDYSGNCGNLSSMIGVYAVDEGIYAPSEVSDGRLTVRTFNTNTQKVIDTTFPVADNGFASLDEPQASVAGVPGLASTIILDFVNPGGARTGKLLPTGSPIENLRITNPAFSITSSCVDATNPTVFVSESELRSCLPIDEYLDNQPAAQKEVGKILEAFRRRGAERMGLDPSAQAQPKIAMISGPHTPDDISRNVDIVINALSMGVLHKAVPMTVGLCLGVATGVRGTLAYDIVRRSREVTRSTGEMIRIRHPGGLVDVGADFDADGSVRNAKVVRTGRRLMKGVVWW